MGKDVNLEYMLPNGKAVKFLDDQKTYFGNQLEMESDGRKYFGVIASMEFLLVSTYEKDGVNPELVLYKKDNCHRMIRFCRRSCKPTGTKLYREDI